MKKILSVFINFSLVIFFCLLPALNSGAVSVDSENIINSVSEALIPEDIENIPDESYKNAEIFGEDLSFENTSSFFDVGKIVSFIFGILTSVLAAKKSYIITLISILTLSFIAQYLGQGLANEKTLSSVRKITVLLTAVSVFFPLWETISDSLTYGETLSSFSVSIMPIFVSLASASGTPSAAVGSSAAVFFSVEFFSWVLAVAVPVFVSVFLSAGIGIFGGRRVKKTFLRGEKYYNCRNDFRLFPYFDRGLFARRNFIRNGYRREKRLKVCGRIGGAGCRGLFVGRARLCLRFGLGVI